MPKELARVMARYGDLQEKVKPLLHELNDYEKNYILMRDIVVVAAEELAEQLKALKVTNAADPRAAKDPGVQRALKQLDKFESLAAENHAPFKVIAKKVDAVRAELGKLEKDVAAVIKAKSGFFTR